MKTKSSEQLIYKNKTKNHIGVLAKTTSYNQCSTITQTTLSAYCPITTTYIDSKKKKVGSSSETNPTVQSYEN
jgi:hypothetical protein